MDFDQIGVQRVAKRRHPSPLRNTRHQTVRDDTVFEQKVWPRPGHSGTALQFETPFPFVFDKYSTKHSKKGGNGTSGTSFGNEDSLNQEVFKRKNRSSATTTGSGFSIPVSWLKPVMIICGILVIGIIGPNWDGISKVFASQDVSPESLQDPGTPLVREAAFEPISIEPVAFGDPSEMGSDVTVYEETQVPAVAGEDFPLNLTKTFTSIEYEVKAGENVSVIADKFSVSMESVIALNGLKDATILYVGKKLKIPNMNGVPYTVKRNDTISRIAEREKIPETTILDANDLRSDMIYVGQVLFLPGARMNSSEYLSAIRRTPEKPMINPVTGRMFITSNYGYRLDPVNPRSGVRRFHEGIDIRGAYGASVKAAMAGTVEEVGNSRVLGNFIILNHNGYRSLYAHLSAFSVRKGARISQGQEIGKIGNSGYSTGSHLHFAVYDKNGNSVNPIGLLK
jgi:murein DD-endopeptidase MepM/ murein hydrolase activator NlpD